MPRFSIVIFVVSVFVSLNETAKATEKKEVKETVEAIEIEKIRGRYCSYIEYRSKLCKDLKDKNKTKGLKNSLK